MKKYLTIALAAILTLGSCTNGQLNNTGKGAMIGTGAGAALGAAVGAIFGGGKGAGIGAAVGAAVGGGTGTYIGNRMDKAKKQAEAALAAAHAEEAAKIETVKDQNNLEALKVTFDGGILFATGKAELSSNARASLSQFAVNVLNQNKDMDVTIYGHTDNTGSDAINNPLSVNRAASVQQYLLQCGVQPSQIKSVMGMGSTQPVADNTTKDGRAQNRRVELFMTASQQMIQAAQNQ